MSTPPNEPVINAGQVQAFHSTLCSLTWMVNYAVRDTLQLHPNPLNRFGNKVYSQNEEDGIITEILRRIGKTSGVFVELGVGNGTENNTLALAAAGWKGAWIGGEDLAFNTNPRGARKLNFHYQKAWIKRSNVVSLIHSGLAAIRESRCDLLSLDLDGNDYHFLKEILAAGIRPDVFVIEYNAKFAPPIRFTVEYDDDHHWRGDDYMGASLSTMDDLLSAKDYILVGCGVTGCNAFYVHKKYADKFADTPREIEKLYAPAKYFLVAYHFAGHPSSLRTIENFMARLNNDEA